VAALFRCTVVTPARAVFDEDVTYVSFPAWDGQQGVMHGRSPLLTRLGIGPMTIENQGGEQRRLLVDGGFAQISQNTLTILTERALEPGDPALQDAERELAEANAAAVKGGPNQRLNEAAQQRARAKRAMASSARG
jgi:F-type H+-transporting ATPase subunit epsilon